MSTDNMPIVPLNNCVIVELSEVMNGVDDTDEACRGCVLAVSPNKVDPWPVTYGDIVFFERKASIAVKIDGKDVLIIREEDLLAVRHR